MSGASLLFGSYRTDSGAGRKRGPTHPAGDAPPDSEAGFL
jgi:hypothetical protein